MIITIILIIPIIGIFILSSYEMSEGVVPSDSYKSIANTDISYSDNNNKLELKNNKTIRSIGLKIGVLALYVTVWVYLIFNNNTMYTQFVQDNFDNIDSRNVPFHFYLGSDGISIFFFFLTSIIIPIAILSNWKSIKEDIKSYLIIILLLETLLLTVFIVLDILFFYIFFESILPPLFILIGLFGAKNKVRAGFYLFLYTLLGSLFLLLSILSISSIIGVSEYNALNKTSLLFGIQIFIFIGIFIAFAVKTPTIFLNIWLLKAHVESPLGGSIILAAIVLKLSLYGIMRLILPVIPEISVAFTYIVYAIATITILYASVSTLRTVDIKELIAYSSVSHAAVYLLGVFSNVFTGIQGAIILGLAHGFVSSGLFTAGGGTLYDRSGTRLITCYRGMTQVMPLFSILFFILCLGNSGTPLTLNFVGEFMCLYGAFNRLPIIGAIASSSIVFSAAYTIYMYNRISFGGRYSGHFTVNFSDLNYREFLILFILVLFTVILGIYPAGLLDGMAYSVSSLIFTGDYNHIYSLSIFILSFNKLKIFKVKSSYNKYFSTSQILFAPNSSDEEDNYSSNSSSKSPSQRNSSPLPDNVPSILPKNNYSEANDDDSQVSSNQSGDLPSSGSDSEDGDLPFTNRTPEGIINNTKYKLRDRLVDTEGTPHHDKLYKKGNKILRDMESSYATNSSDKRSLIDLDSQLDAEYDKIYFYRNGRAISETSSVNRDYVNTPFLPERGNQALPLNTDNNSASSNNNSRNNSESPVNNPGVNNSNVNQELPVNVTSRNNSLQPDSGVRETTESVNTDAQVTETTESVNTLKRKRSESLSEEEDLPSKRFKDLKKSSNQNNDDDDDNNPKGDGNSGANIGGYSGGDVGGNSGGDVGGNYTSRTIIQEILNLIPDLDIDHFVTEEELANLDSQISFDHYLSNQNWDSLNDLSSLDDFDYWDIF